MEGKALGDVREKAERRLLIVLGAQSPKPPSSGHRALP